MYRDCGMGGSLELPQTAQILRNRAGDAEFHHRPELFALLPILLPSASRPVVDREYRAAPGHVQDVFSGVRRERAGVDRANDGCADGFVQLERRHDR